jgi:Na+-transporting methylmalonyl-CoA/oxaloacetate decarboxylase gamma subunit
MIYPNGDDVVPLPALNDLDLCPGQAVELIDQGINGLISGLDVAMEALFFLIYAVLCRTKTGERQMGRIRGGHKKTQAGQDFLCPAVHQAEFLLNFPSRFDNIRR